MKGKFTKSELIYVITNDLALDYNDRDEFEHDIETRQAKKWSGAIRDNCSHSIYQQFRKAFC